LLVALGAIALGATGPAFAADREPLSKVFKYLDVYLGLAPAQRSHFRLVFRALRDERPAPDLQATMIGADGARRPLLLNAAGEVVNLPGLGDLKGGGQLEIANAQGIRFATEIRPDVAPAQRLDVGALVQSLDQANAAIAHLAGAFAVMAPKLDSIVFPDGGTGVAAFGDGRVAPLPITTSLKTLGPTPYFQPFNMGQARVISLSREPSRIIMAVRPH
jgi:hypothetical protein